MQIQTSVFPRDFATTLTDLSSFNICRKRVQAHAATARHKKLENTDLYTQLINFESNEWHVAHAGNLEEEGKLIEASFEYVRYSDKDEVAIYRKRK